MKCFTRSSDDRSIQTPGIQINFSYLCITFSSAKVAETNSQCVIEYTMELKLLLLQ